MKRVINSKLQFFAFCVAITNLLFSCSPPNQVSTVAPEDITKSINNDNWKFTATFVTPNYGRSRNLTTDYFVTVSNKKLSVALPYYGKLNSPAGAMSGNPLDFTSTEFKMTKETKGEGWIITIKDPNQEVESMIFTFYDNGTARLDVSMTNRTGISYSGKVMPANP